MNYPVSVSNFVRTFEDVYGHSTQWETRQSFNGYSSKSLNDEDLQFLNNGITWWNYKSGTSLNGENKRVFIFTVQIDQADFVSPLLHSEPQKLDSFIRRTIGCVDFVFESFSFKYENVEREGRYELLIMLIYNRQSTETIDAH